MWIPHNWYRFECIFSSNMHRIQNPSAVTLRAVLWVVNEARQSVVMNILSCLRSWPWSTGIMENFRLGKKLQNHRGENLLIWSWGPFPFCLGDGWEGEHLSLVSSWGFCNSPGPHGVPQLFAASCHQETRSSSQRLIDSPGLPWPSAWPSVTTGILTSCWVYVDPVFGLYSDMDIWKKHPTLIYPTIKTDSIKWLPAIQ